MNCGSAQHPFDLVPESQLKLFCTIAGNNCAEFSQLLGTDGKSCLLCENAIDSCNLIYDLLNWDWPNTDCEVTLTVFIRSKLGLPVIE